MEHPQENAKARGKSQKPRAMTAYQEARTLAGAILPEGIFFVFRFVLSERAFRVSKARVQFCCDAPLSSSFPSGLPQEPP